MLIDARCLSAPGTTHYCSLGGCHCVVVVCGCFHWFLIFLWLLPMPMPTICRLCWGFPHLESFKILIFPKSKTSKSQSLQECHVWEFWKFEKNIKWKVWNSNKYLGNVKVKMLFSSHSSPKISNFKKCRYTDFRQFSFCQITMLVENYFLPDARIANQPCSRGQKLSGNMSEYSCNE